VKLNLTPASKLSKMLQAATSSKAHARSAVAMPAPAVARVPRVALAASAVTRSGAVALAHVAQKLQSRRLVNVIAQAAAAPTYADKSYTEQVSSAMVWA
jgi:hypothetical protein